MHLFQAFSPGTKRKSPERNLFKKPSQYSRYRQGSLRSWRCRSELGVPQGGRFGPGPANRTFVLLPRPRPLSSVQAGVPARFWHQAPWEILRSAFPLAVMCSGVIWFKNNFASKFKNKTQYLFLHIFLQMIKEARDFFPLICLWEKHGVPERQPSQ